MKKIIAVIPITILFILLSFNIKVSAVTAGAFGWYIVYNPSYGTYNYHVIAYTFDHYKYRTKDYKQYTNQMHPQLQQIL